MSDSNDPRVVIPHGIQEEPRGPVWYPKLTGNELCWFALYVQVNHEKEVTRRLEERSVDCYLPLVESWSKRRDRRKRIHTPLFPGYVFVHSVLDNYSHVHILKTPGAVSLVRNSEGALPIPDFQIDNLKTLIESSAPLSPHAYLNRGDWVQVIRGPMAGCCGILLRHNPKKGRLVVSVDIIQRSVSVELDVEDVEPVRSPVRP
ncbi:MAG TPA: UpxY family transcription antiterminator [Syntrophobacteraceae bacterium]|nr:UpxY family transcription antiterminator [Syntrophobacteraceae bacterium]